MVRKERLRRKVFEAVDEYFGVEELTDKIEGNA